MLHFKTNVLTASVAIACLAGVPLARAADDAALDLESAEPSTPAPQAKPVGSEGAGLGGASVRAFGEVGAGRVLSTTASGQTRNSLRVGLDGAYNRRLGQGLKLTLSNRLDGQYPHATGERRWVNTLREAYLTWGDPAGGTLWDTGRVNLRQGSGYGFNPTDFFRQGSLRVISTANPLTLRERRQGTFALRGQQLGTDSTFSVVLAPKLGNQRTDDTWSLDAGATNSRHRLMLSAGKQWSQRASTQLSLYKSSTEAAGLGFSGSFLLGDALTAHAEWANKGADADLQAASGRRRGNETVLGWTLTTASKTSITAEWQHSDFGWRGSESRAALLASPSAAVGRFLNAEYQQDLASRDALLVYVSQPDIGLRNLDLVGLWKRNLSDRSQLVWLELRRRWERFELAGQVQWKSGEVDSQFGLTGDRRSVGVTGLARF